MILFARLTIQSIIFSYQHDLSTSALDYFKLRITDRYRVSDPITIYVNVSQRTVWDYGTTIYANQTIFLKEGGTIELHTRMFPNSSMAKTRPEKVVFFLAQRPTKGKILRNNGEVKSYTW